MLNKLKPTEEDFNVRCIFCDAKINEKFFPNLKCLKCGKSAKIEITKESGEIYLKIPAILGGKYLPKINLTNL